MNDLIKVNYDNDRPTVLARDLHEMLEVKTAYKDWFTVRFVGLQPILYWYMDLDGHRELFAFVR